MDNKFDDFSAQIDDFGLSQDEVIEKKKEGNFLPWHKPRKQWVRDRQWWGQIEKHFISQGDALIGTDVIKYFGLPGDDLLDVRFFQQKLSNLDKEIFVLGLLNSQDGWSAAQKQLSKTLDLSGIHRDSAIERLDFDHLDKAPSIAYDKLKRFGPFHIVNLDFCDNLISPSLGLRRLNAIKNLMNYQFQTTPNRWLLFLTTRSSKSSSCMDSFEPLAECIDRNLEDGNFFSEFMKHFSEILPHGTKSLDRASLDGENYIGMYVVGIFKWLIECAIQKGFKLKLDSIVRYDIEGEEEDNDMVSMCLVFNRVLQLPAGGYGDELPLEPEMAKRGLNKIKAVKSLDHIMVSDVDVYVECVKKKIELLRGAGRSVDQYIEEMCAADLDLMGLKVTELYERIS